MRTEIPEISVYQLKGPSYSLLITLRKNSTALFIYCEKSY